MSIENRIEDILRQFDVFNFKGGHTVRQNMAYVIVEELGLYKVTQPEYPAAWNAGVQISEPGPPITQWRTPWVRDE